jgi:hypothetical protein
VSLLEARDAFANGKKYKDFDCKYECGEGNRSYERAQRDTMKLPSFGK